MVRNCLNVMMLLLASVYTEPNTEYYTQQTKVLSDRLENVYNEDFYKDWIAENTGTDKTFKIKDLTDLEKDVFFLYQSDKLYSDLSYRASKWITIYDHAATFAKNNNDKNAQEFADELMVIIIDVRNMQFKLANKHEDFTDNLIKKYKDKPYEDALKKYAKHIRDKYKRNGMPK